jgi:hypothetical protein
MFAGSPQWAQNLAVAGVSMFPQLAQVADCLDPHSGQKFERGGNSPPHELQRTPRIMKPRAPQRS